MGKFFGFQALRTVEAFCSGGCVLLIVIPLPIADAGTDNRSRLLPDLESRICRALPSKRFRRFCERDVRISV